MSENTTNAVSGGASGANGPERFTAEEVRLLRALRRLGVLDAKGAWWSFCRTIEARGGRRAVGAECDGANPIAGGGASFVAPRFADAVEAVCEFLERAEQLAMTGAAPPSPPKAKTEESGGGE